MMIVVCCFRNYCERKNRRRIARSDSDHRPPSLPDGHAVNVVHLNAAINRVCLFTHHAVGLLCISMHSEVLKALPI